MATTLSEKPAKPVRKPRLPALSFRLPAFPGTKDIDYHPYFKGAISRWAWRFYTHLLTRSGRGFLLVTLFFLAYGSNSLELQAYVPCLYLLGLWVVAILASGIWRPRVALQARHAERVCAGETVPVEVEVEQKRRLVGTDLSVLPSGLPPTIDAMPEDGVGLPSLARGKKARVTLGLHCKRRGVYTLPGFRVETDFPFGLLNAYRILRAPSPLLVYPAFTRMTHLNIPTGRRYQPGGVALASTLGDSFEYLGNREYREGDNIRDIDWRATARLQTPIVREYREEYFLRVAVILDTHIPPGATEAQREDFERAVSVCAAVGDYMSRSDYIVDLFAAGPNLYHLTAGRSLAYLDQILDILACVEEHPGEPFEVIEPEIMESLSRITTVICVFLDWNESRRAFAHRLGREGAGLKVIIARDAPCTLDPGADDIVGPITVLSVADFAAGVEEL